MKKTNPVDAARIELMLSDLRLPAIKSMWVKLAEQSDKEGWPPPASLPRSPSTRSPIAVVAASSVIWPRPDCPSARRSQASTSPPFPW